jgi:hypothetical protein
VGLVGKKERGWLLVGKREGLQGLHALAGGWYSQTCAVASQS